MLKKFTVIVFDLGGVLYHIDVQQSVTAFKNLGLKNFDHLYSLQEQSNIFDLLEVGKINALEFSQLINEKCGLQLKHQEIIAAWESLLLEMPAENIEILMKLKEKHEIYLLSNTNIIHLEAINRHMQQKHNIENLDLLFTEAFYSFKIGHRKPDKVCYDFVTEKIGVQPNEILFIDDNQENVEGAIAAGWQAIKKDKEQAFSTFIKQYFA